MPSTIQILTDSTPVNLGTSVTGVHVRGSMVQFTVGDAAAPNADTWVDLPEDKVFPLEADPDNIWIRTTVGSTDYPSEVVVYTS